MTAIFDSVVPIFMMGLIGSLMKRKWIQSDEFWRGLEKLLYFILFPATLITFIQSANFKAYSIFNLILSIVIAKVVISVGLILYQKKYIISGPKFASLFQGSIRYNSYVFFSIGGALFDRDGMSVIAAVSAYMIIIVNIMSISIFNYYVKNGETRENYNNFMLKSLVKNPLIIASLVGIFLNCFGISLATSVNKTLNLLSGAAFPIGSLIIGAGLHFNLQREEVRSIALASAIKLIGMPIVLACVMKIAGVSGISKHVGIVYASLPTATNAYILSRQLGGDSELMSSIITVTTLLFLVSLSVMLYFFV